MHIRLRRKENRTDEEIQRRYKQSNSRDDKREELGRQRKGSYDREGDRDIRDRPTQQLRKDDARSEKYGNNSKEVRRENARREEIKVRLPGDQRTKIDKTMEISDKQRNARKDKPTDKEPGDSSLRNYFLQMGRKHGVWKESTRSRARLGKTIKR